MSIRNYRDLVVWQKSMDLVVNCYRITEQFPKIEIYGLTSQLQRAAVSVAANIAEGNGRSHTREYLNHLSMAYGSLMEVALHLKSENQHTFDSSVISQPMDRQQCRTVVG
ncbi:MAG TPA: four helix bundle protein [Blastocatellia bacterium]|nr:four helix bundle protein [Blastocatellia bacterium]